MLYITHLTLSPQRLVGFADLGFVREGHRPAVQHLHDLPLHLLRRGVAHVLERRGEERRGEERWSKERPGQRGHVHTEI